MEDERREELETLLAIFPELITDFDGPFTASLELAINPLSSLLIRFIPDQPVSSPLVRSLPGHPPPTAIYAKTVSGIAAHVEHDVKLSYLPPLTLRMNLSESYPGSAPPQIRLSTQLDWLPSDVILRLEQEAIHLWEEYGRGPILYVYIDYLQQAAERGFDLEQSAEGCLILSSKSEPALVAYDAKTKKAIFESGTYDCGVCLERRKGSDCYQIERCRHIFCRECLQAFYNNAIKEGDIAGIRCLDPDCGTERAVGQPQAVKRKKQQTLHPRELLAMGIEEGVVRRFLEMKRKKKLEADKSTVYCPRTWCQGAAKSAKYPPVPADLTAYISSKLVSDEDNDDDAETATSKTSRSPGTKPPLPDPSDRLAVCEKCSLAFCRICYMGWHGPFARCYPRDPNELSAEDKASYEYIRMNTSPCAYCNAPVQKTMGCNHMRCFQCNTHFCYLCSAWLDPQSPYTHFNTSGKPCFQRLWELEEGDEGQAPGDGQGFANGRDWERIAVEVAREAEAAEAEAAALQAQTEEDEEVARALVAAPEPPPAVHPVPLEVAIAQVRLHDPQQPAAAAQPPRAAGRRQRNPFPARPPAQGQANAVRNHERGEARRRPVAGAVEPRDNGWDDRRQAELQRFLELAQRDEEDGWDSDELGDDDEGFVIR